MQIFLISDISFNNKEKTGKLTLEQYNEKLISKWNSVVNDQDTVVVMGNFARGSGREIREIIQKLNGIIYMVQFKYNAFFTIDRWKRLGINMVNNCNFSYTFNKQTNEKIYFPLTAEDYKENLYNCGGEEQGINEVFDGKTLSLSAKFWDYTPIKIEEIPKIFDRMKSFI